MKSVCCAFVALIVFLMAMPQAWSLETGRDWMQTPQPWTTPWTARGTHSSVVFQDRLWIIGGHSQQRCVNDVWSSQDGVNWVQVTPEAPWSRGCVTRRLSLTVTFGSSVAVTTIVAITAMCGGPPTVPTGNWLPLRRHGQNDVVTSR